MRGGGSMRACHRRNRTRPYARTRNRHGRASARLSGDSLRLGDARSDSSLRANASRLDVSVTGWIQLDSLTGRPTELYPDDPAAAPTTTRLALVSSYHGQRFHPEVVRALAAADDRALATAAQGVAAIVSSGSV